MKSATTELSVVIASVNGRAFLERCLAALARQEGSGPSEVIVADRVGGEVTELLGREYPQVRLISLDRSTSLPLLRARAIRASQGAVVASLGDYCEPPTSWCREIIAAHAEHPELAIGGTIEPPSPRSMADRVAFLCEYGVFVDPRPEEKVTELPGPNVSYKRRAFELAPDLLDDGFWETHLHHELARQGQSLRSSNRLVVHHRKHYAASGFCRERYHYGRAFAGARGGRLPPGRRLLHAVTAPGLPFLLSARICRRLAPRLSAIRVATMLPYILLFMSAAGLGEGLGYLFGPGRSLTEFT